MQILPNCKITETWVVISKPVATKAGVFLMIAMNLKIQFPLIILELRPQVDCTRDLEEKSTITIINMAPFSKILPRIQLGSNLKLFQDLVKLFLARLHLRNGFGMWLGCCPRNTVHTTVSSFLIIFAEISVLSAKNNLLVGLDLSTIILVQKQKSKQSVIGPKL